MSNISGSFNLNTVKTYTDRYTLNDGNTGIIGVGAILAPTGSSNPAVTFKFASANTSESLTNSGTIDSTLDRALYGSGLLSGDSVVITNNATGVILGAFAATGASGENNDAFKIKSDFANGSVTLNNSGVLVAGSYAAGVVGLASGAVTSGQAVDLDDIASSLVTINNYAGGLIESADSDAIRPGADAIINNYGSIVAGHLGNSTSGNNGVAFQDHTTGSATINNYAGGSITGAHHGITGAFSITVVNAGTITGQLGSGINMDTTSGTTVVTNTGTITGNAGGTTDGDGIDVDYMLNLDNSGTVSATGSSTGGLSEAVTIGGGVITNEATGKIVSNQRAITVDDSNGGNAFAATTITNYGLIEGDDGEAIKITDLYADTLTNAGTILGSVDLGGGDDVFNLWTGSSITGTIEGGAGNDTVNLEGSGAGAVGNLADIETVNLVGGTWTLASETETTVHFGAGAQNLILAASVISDGSFASTVTGFGTDDTFDLAGVGTAIAATLGANNLLTVSGGAETVTIQLDPSANYSGSTFAVASDGNGGSIVTNVICFYRGTRIAVPGGEAAVETLKAGDLVLTADGRAAPVRWMGRQTVSTRFACPLRVLPIRIRAGALGADLPARDLLVSPDHALLIGDVLVHAGALVNGASIFRESDVPESFTYWHIELADHALVRAEGVAAETFIDNVDRMAFDNWDEHAAAHEPPPMREMPYPRAKSARQVPPSVRRMLTARASALVGPRAA
ncbi:Hint domain-containing protein [Rhodoblastus sp.]|uniref:Hint domain-containing protein n=1 Tax=Rhodoblastus sp. TaxID=1962975 RepID=UPI0035ADFC82